VTSFRPSRPPLSHQHALRNLARVAFTRATAKRLWQKMKHDRLFLRSSALAFETLLSIVPLMAVAMSAVRVLGGNELEATLLRFFADEYVPASAGPAVNEALALVQRADFSTIGWFGLVALVPVMFSLVDAVELALADIFRAPRHTHWVRLLLLGCLLTLAPLGSVLTVRYVPVSRLAYYHLLTPLLLIAGALYVVFRRLPKVSISDRAALSGAFTAGILLSLAKAGFGLYATHLARSIHIVWGAIAFVPLLLIWVLLTWTIVLFGAELTSVLETELSALEHPTARRRRAGSLRGRRLRRRIIHKRRLTQPPPLAKSPQLPKGARPGENPQEHSKPPSPSAPR
jgi:membrane protein